MSAVYRARVGPDLQVTGELEWHGQDPGGPDPALESRVRSKMRSHLDVVSGMRRGAMTPCSGLRLTCRRDGSVELRLLPGDPDDPRLPLVEACRRAAIAL